MRRIVPLLLVCAPLLSAFSVNAGVVWVQPPQQSTQTWAQPFWVNEGEYGFRLLRGSGWDYASGGHRGRHMIHFGSDQAEAEWVFGLLPYGTYDVQITWPSGSYLSDDVSFRVSDGDDVFTSGSFSQRFPGASIDTDGIRWTSLGRHVFTEGAATVTIRGYGVIAADAVRMVPVR